MADNLVELIFLQVCWVVLAHFGEKEIVYLW